MLVSWDDYSKYMEKKEMFQTTNQFLICKECQHPNILSFQPADLRRAPCVMVLKAHGMQNVSVTQKSTLYSEYIVNI